MIKFEKIRWRNFLSTGNVFTELQLNKTETTLISGENGAGKTTVLDAIVFCLFGKPYRNINIPQLVNSINQKDCVTEIEFDVSGIKYKVRRGIAPKFFEIYKDGKLIDQDATNKDYQKMFEDQILRMSYKSFCQVVILGSTNYVPFMRLTAAERRSVVENLLDIDVFSNMNILLKGKLSLLKDQQKDADTKIVLLRERAEGQKKLVKTLESSNKEQIEKSHSSLEEYRKEIETLTEENEKLLTQVDELEKKLIPTDMSIQDIELSKIETEESKLEKEISFYEKNSSCTRCKQELCEEHKQSITKVLKEDLSNLSAKKSTVLGRMKVIKDHMESNSKTNKAITDLNKQIQLNNAKIASAKGIINKTTEQINKAANDTKNVDDEKEKFNLLVQEGLNATENRKIIVEDVHYHTIAASLLKDSGIKGKIIKHYLPIMNKVINKYLAQMDFFVQFELSESFEETIKSRHRDIFTYDSFSEGEKRKIDLALLFAWRKIAAIKNSLSCNLLIFDEVLDGSLDDYATESFLNILKSFGSDTNIYVISHKSKELLQDKFQQHISFIKKNNFSKML
jgi:DNA repair exonuclease SbcCD ATPase subunit